MTNKDTTPTSGAADRAIEGCPELNMGNYDEVDVERLNDWAIRAHDEIDRLHALAAGQATAAPAVVQDDLITIRKPTTSAELLWLLKLAHLVISDVDKALEETFAPAQPAASGATEEVENLRKALVYAAFALHDAPQYMLAQGITLIDGDTVRVSRDGWTVEASVNPHRIRCLPTV